MDENKKMSHKERMLARIEENNELIKIEEERIRRKKQSLKRHKQAHKQKALSLFFQKISSFFYRNDTEKAEKIKHNRIEKHIRQKRVLSIKKTVSDFVKHPFGTEEHKLFRKEKQRQKKIEKRIKSKIFKLKITAFKQNIADIIAAFKNKTIRNKLFNVFGLSTVLFVLAYLTVFTIGNIITSLVASFCSIDTIINASIIIYKPSPYSPLWTVGSVVSIFSAQTFVAIFISLFSLWIFFKSSKKSYLVKIYLLWLVLLGQGFAWGSFFGAIIRKQGIYHALSWGSYNSIISINTISIIMIVISFIALLLFGNLIRRLYFYVSPSSTLLKRAYRRIYLHFLISIPFVVGLIIIAAINRPVYNLYTFIQLLSMFILFLPLFMIKENEYSDIGQFKIVKSKINLGVIIGVFLLVILIYKIIFEIGINF